MKVVVLVGGVGGARFLLGVKSALGLPIHGEAPESSPHQITAIVNTGDDVRMHDLQICPDLDTCMYTLSGAIDDVKGWGRSEETWTVQEELAAYGVEPDWFGLGDRDIATHLVRTRMLRAGYPLSSVTEALSDRWRPGVHLLPMSDDRVETHVVIDDPNSGDGARRAVHFQEWWVRYRAEPAAHAIGPVGIENAAPAPGLLEAVKEADVVLLAPSNPVVSVGTILAVPGVRDALRETKAPVIGVSPIIGGRPLRGMADACLAAIDVESTAEAVGRHYGSRSASEDGLLDGWLVHTGDDAQVPGVAVRAVPLLMTSPEATSAMVHAAFDLAGVQA
ncbi:2-phospho-L-lactate transferase [Actinoalloteichus hymeniacidonis]|uniref:LPPG:FO 2-phospho-L-lactate transferase n=1 Tax=Actinoalloteichus hymeniacidonis TaxID=340345 RepID=A0AAC9HUP4_9PSEU|nr:2-phospho-L-lactate transferase [Actinoalloteichus hymeniacidonis]AOS65456.1 LPPG:FO 2-phospho-L-lactate transferase [Actinoalloteichus hymeniacidonis]MBB5906457.1 LPPG:FO 2-phospho-L-lactate transferase [Actinoalloteichus hymeniacidonis]